MITAMAINIKMESRMMVMSLVTHIHFGLAELFSLP